ncbi:hypothetical protein GCM10012275_19250 [Longimycelium tulufanense]|uniref:Uncharacterized protein n=1 Tax=Longimycelium tulufanense TaxID=907463 RepID=A0A8J3C7B3_9PSEU|nr:hypothetical protein [Longimycelium tulufanense]GGM48429.1 hypothetical protein GCM10012275_19250 [Longimycelium tulufanense]
MSDVIRVDLDDLTIDEIEMLEDLLNAPLDEVATPGRRKGPFLRAIACVIKRREDPEFPLEAAGSLKVKLGDSPENPPGLVAS